ncbi:hypothetical protein MBLNU13_g06797t1 [Cladosporium sp. NU13]
MALRVFALHNNCSEAPRRRQRWWMFGTDTIYESYRWKKQHAYLELLLKNFNDYGKTYTSRVLGVNKLTTMEPANIEAILRTKWEDFIARPARTIPLDGLPQSPRRPSIYSEHFDRFMQHVPKDGAIVDLQDLFFRLTMDSSTAHLLGCSSRTLATTSELSPEPELAGAFDRAQRAAVEKFALGWADRLRPQPQYWRDTRLVWNFAQRYVDIALQRKRARSATAKPIGDPEAKTKQSNFLDEICERTEDADEIHKGALHLLVAGRDSTASLLSNLWFMLARDKRIWKKLKEEVETLDGAIPDNEAVKRLSYLRNCINESLRCHPAIPWSLRAAARDTVLPTGGGPDGNAPIAVAQGTTVLVPLYCLHRHEDYWGPDAHIFRPERWDTSSAADWTYIPFLAGPRMCLGYQFAINTASYVTIRLIQLVDSVEAEGNGPWREELGLSMTSAEGARMSLNFRAE